MATQLTTTGYQGTSYSVRRTALVASLRASNSELTNVDFGSDTPEGEIIDQVCQIHTDLDEAVEAAWNALDPANATDATALSIARLRGVVPRYAQYGEVPATVNLGASKTFAARTMIAWVDGEPNNRWVNRDEVTSTTAGDYSAIFVSEYPGSEAVAPAGTLTEMISLTGWNSITNATDAQEGTNEDTPRQTLIRSETQIYKTQQNKLASMRAAIREVTGVVDANVVNGTGDCNPIIWDGVGSVADDDEVAAAIWAHLPPGIGTTGATANTSTGYGVNFDRATQQQVYADVSYTGPSVTQAQVKAALQSAMPDELGEDVIWAQLLAAVLALDGVTDASLAIDTSASPVDTDNITTANNKISVLDSGNITFS